MTTPTPEGRDTTEHGATPASEASTNTETPQQTAAATPAPEAEPSLLEQMGGLTGLVLSLIHI